MQGQFFWYDVMTTDVTAASKFYSTVIGWEAQDASGGGKDYTVFSVNGIGVAGLLAIPEDVARRGVKPAWLGYVAVDDVDAAVARVKQEGGTVHREPETVPGVIRFAVVGDPQGAPFYVARGLLHEGPPPEPPAGAPGTIGWRELLAGEWKSAFAFYEKMFGWTKTDSFDMGPMGAYQLFATGGAPVGGMMTKPPAMAWPSWRYYFNVTAIDPAAERVKAAGGAVLMGPTEVPGGQWIVQCEDPQGAFFGLVAPKR
jgi:uncharacterized protein